MCRERLGVRAAADTGDAEGGKPQMHVMIVPSGLALRHFREVTRPTTATTIVDLVAFIAQRYRCRPGDVRVISYIAS